MALVSRHLMTLLIKIMASFTTILNRPAPVPTQYKVVVWNVRSKRPRKPRFFNKEKDAMMFGYFIADDEKVEYIEYFRLVNNKWEKY